MIWKFVSYMVCWFSAKGWRVKLKIIPFVPLALLVGFVRLVQKNDFAADLRRWALYHRFGAIMLLRCEPYFDIK